MMSIEFIKPAAASVTEFVAVVGFGRVGISLAPARGGKCGRCWRYQEEVAEEGALCARCQKVVDELAPQEVPTA